LRRGRVEPVVRQSRRTGQQKAPAGWIARKVRDIVLPMFLRKGADAARELYGYALPKWDQPLASMHNATAGSSRPPGGRNPHETCQTTWTVHPGDQ